MKFFYAWVFEIWLYFQKQIRKSENIVMFSLTSRDAKTVRPTRSLYDIWFKSYDSNSCFHGFWWPWPWPLADLKKKILIGAKLWPVGGVTDRQTNRQTDRQTNGTDQYTLRKRPSGFRKVITKPKQKATDDKLRQLQSRCGSSSGVTMRNQSVQEDAHAQEAMWTVLNFANLVEVTAVTTLHHQLLAYIYIEYD